jgi:hypothetical protein
MWGVTLLYILTKKWTKRKRVAEKALGGSGVYREMPLSQIL